MSSTDTTKSTSANQPTLMRRHGYRNSKVPTKHGGTTVPGTTHHGKFPSLILNPPTGIWTLANSIPFCSKVAARKYPKITSAPTITKEDRRDCRLRTPPPRAVLYNSLPETTQGVPYESLPSPAPPKQKSYKAAIKASPSTNHRQDQYHLGAQANRRLHNTEDTIGEPAPI